MSRTPARIVAATGIAWLAAALTLSACTSSGTSSAQAGSQNTNAATSSQTGVPTGETPGTSGSASGNTEPTTATTPTTPTRTTPTRTKTGSGGTGGHPATSTAPPPKQSTPPGTVSVAGRKDVSLGAIKVRTKDGTPTAKITITNHSAKRSNYIVDLSITTSDGTTQLDAAMVSAGSVKPSQTVTRTAEFTTTQKLPAGAKLAIVNVARIAA